MSRSQSELVDVGRSALERDDTHSAIAALLELDARFDDDPWVLESLASIHQALLLPEPGIRYLERREALGASESVAALRQKLEHDFEVFYRDLARFETATGRFKKAFRAALTASEVSDPSTWTIRVLVDAAIADGKQDEAVATLRRVAELRPDDEKLAEFEHRLHG